MNGLRMFRLRDCPDVVPEVSIFFSRRGNGPYYRWNYENKVADWHVARVLSSDFDPHSLSAAAWKIVPMSLQTRLALHYSE